MSFSGAVSVFIERWIVSSSSWNELVKGAVGEVVSSVCVCLSACDCLVPVEVYCLCWWLWLYSLVHSAAWCWTPPLLHCLPCHELVFSVFPGRGLSPWHETKGSHSQGPQATQVCSSSPHTLLIPCFTVPTKCPLISSSLFFSFHLYFKHLNIQS